MLRTSIQSYLCAKNETVSVDSQSSGGALSFFLDDTAIAGPAFNFSMSKATRKLSGVLTGPVGTQAGIRIRTVTNRPNNQDITVLTVGANSNHAATIWDFAVGDSGVLSFVSSATKKAPKKGVKKPRKAKKGGGNI